MGRCEWGGRISDTKGRGGQRGQGVRWECGGAGRSGGGGCAGMQNEEISKKTVGEWGDYSPYTWS
jgi:hypothetical protein